MSDISGELFECLREQCRVGAISYRDYIHTVLYTPDYGYYKQSTKRVGRVPRSDFYTAESLGPVFAKLISAAVVDLLPEGQARRSTFIEIGAEPDTSLLSHLECCPFYAEQVIRQGDPIILNGPVVIFANEWLDALPFHRLIFQGGRWCERGVQIGSDNRIKETLLDELSPEVAAVADRLPQSVEAGYELDLPLEAELALENLLSQNWNGLILLVDYGRTWTALLQDHPFGTARTYKNHVQGSDLLKAPGSCDITCDLCWTPLFEQMQAKGLHDVTLESQESFIVRRAQRVAQDIVESAAGTFSAEYRTFMELIHAANMGQRFQVLRGLRED